MVIGLCISFAFEKYRADHIVMKNQSPKTEESYFTASKLLVRYFGDIDLSTLTFEMVRDWRSHLSTWQSPDTVRGNVICLRNVLKFARKNGYEVLDYELIPVQKKEKRIIKYLTEEEMEVFITEVGRKVRGYSEHNRLRNVAMVRVLQVTGLRNGEICALNRDSIKNRRFTIVGKSRDPRISFITAKAEESLNEYLNIRTDKNKALFISPQTGERITSDTLRKVFRFTCERSEFEDVHPHTIRHSFATMMLDRGVDIIYVSDFMGHADLNTTKIYTHYSNKKLEQVYESALAY